MWMDQIIILDINLIKIDFSKKRFYKKHGRYAWQFH